MKKIISLALSLFMIIPVLTGCNSNSDANTTTKAADTTKAAAESKSSDTDSEKTEENEKAEESEKPASSEAVEIEFWDMTWGPTEYINTAEALVKKFNEQSENITVKYQSTPWSNWYQTFSTAIASGTAPDISTGAGYQAFQFAKTGAILPIDDVIEDMQASGDLDDFPEDTVAPLKYDGQQIAFPWNQDIRVLWYNTEIFENAGVQPPTSFEELRSAAKAVSKDGIYGLSIGAAQNGGVHLLLTLLLNNGGGLFDENGEVAVSSNERNLEVLQLIYDMANDGSINPAAAGYSGDDAERAFVSGQAAMILSNAAMHKKYPELEGKIDICDPLTGFAGDSATLKWINNIMIYSSTEHPDETKEFLKWWVTNQKDLFTEGGLTSLPVSISSAQDSYYTNDPIISKALNELAPIGKTTAAKSPYIFGELNEIEGDDVLPKVMQGLIMQQDPAKLLEDLQTGIEGIMAKAKAAS